PTWSPITPPIAAPPTVPNTPPPVNTAPATPPRPAPVTVLFCLWLMPSQEEQPLTATSKTATALILAMFVDFIHISKKREQRARNDPNFHGDATQCERSLLA